MNNDMQYLAWLEGLARRYGFRFPVPDETWPGYVDALADHVELTDLRMATEIRTGLAWCCAA